MTYQLSYAQTIEDGTPVAFFEQEMRSGIIYQGKIHWCDNGVYKQAYFKPNAVIPIPTELVRTMWEYFLEIWDILVEPDRDSVLIYKEEPLENNEPGAQYYTRMNNLKKLNWIDESQRNRGLLLYRFMSFMLPGERVAFYQVTEICGVFAKISACKGVGCGLAKAEYGEVAVIPIHEVQAYFKKKDLLENIFGNDY